jgi:hypothetical protein
MRNCIRGEMKAAADAAVVKNAAKACKAERAADPAGFREQYGSNGNGKNAFGKCVSANVSDRDDDDGTGENASDGGDESDADEELPAPDQLP